MLQVYKFSRTINKNIDQSCQYHEDRHTISDLQLIRPTVKYFFPTNNYFFVPFAWISKTFPEVCHSYTTKNIKQIDQTFLLLRHYFYWHERTHEDHSIQCIPEQKLQALFFGPIHFTHRHVDATYCRLLAYL